ncbi:GAF domain-containing protein [Caloramator sp. E03]|uniref:GAF domain-containing protein n=1 Tax=Caloramator sp. E03 TaxID=2576307 RepID=UPI00111007D8|nr:GAF domain-containing protein [Caloramator sp. E03]QCX34210.1 GAF domain-containing protein [Caloramator sp. E03]
MEYIDKITGSTKDEFYNNLLLIIEGLISGEEDSLANLCNVASVLYNNLDDINWVGFYRMKNGELLLGPFGGKPACVRIKIGRGVCGSAARDKRTYVVANVHEFEGHIACDSASNSEIVVPIIKDDVVFGVLDIDSPIFNRFDETDRIYLEKLVEKLNQYIKWEDISRI